MATPSSPYYVGALRHQKGTAERNVDGIIDEVMILNRRLSPREIKEIYESQK